MRLCIALLCLAFSFCAHASALDAPPEDLEVSLVTYGPGLIYWERFGHDAIRLTDRESGDSVDFNYGVFDFDQSAFIWRFARGYMRYMIDVEHSDGTQQDYIDAGRLVLQQRLDLSAAQAETLRNALAVNLLPENMAYNYDYLTNNCATRVRDAFDSVLGGALRKALEARPAPMTYRQQIDRLMSAQAWMMLSMDLGLGPMADRPLNEWQESFLPMVLAREIRSVRIPDGHGGDKPLVLSEQQIAPNRLPEVRAAPPDLRWPLGIVGVTVAALMLVSRARFPTLYRYLTATYLVLAGVVGTFLATLWLFTQHHAAWENANLLVFNPFAFAMLPRRQFVRILIGLQLCAAFVALLLHLFPGMTQQNLPWLFLAIPIWLAITPELIR